MVRFKPTYAQEIILVLNHLDAWRRVNKKQQIDRKKCIPIFIFLTLHIIIGWHLGNILTSDCVNDNILSSELRVYFVFFMTASTVRGPSNLILDKIVKHHFFFAMVTKRFFPLHIHNQASNSERSPSILQAWRRKRKKWKP